MVTAWAVGTALVLLVWIYGIFDVAAIDEDRVRRFPRATWILIVLFFSVFGVAAWFAWGRPRGIGLTPGGRVGAPDASMRSTPAARSTGAPDDDPEFLASLAKLYPPPDDDDRHRG